MVPALRTWFEAQRLRVPTLLALAFVIGSTVAQFLPLVGEMGYDYALVVALLLTVLGSAVLLRLEATSLTLWVVRAACVLAALTVVAGLIGTANMLRIPSCDPVAAWRHLLLHAAGAAPWIIATCAVCRAAAGRWRGRRGGILLTGFLLISVVAGLAWLYAQPAIHVYHPWLGHVAASIYDESLADAAPHLWFRAYTTFAALFFLALLALRTRPTPARASVALVLLFGSLLLWSQRAPLGFEISRAAVEQELGGMIDTRHFRIHYDATHFSPAQVRLLAYDHEARYAELARFWNVRPLTRLRSYVYGDRDRKGELMGGRSTMVAKIWLGEMHILWRGVGDEMLAHELAHLFLREDGRGPLRLSLFRNGLPNMGLTEGAAVAAAWGARDLNYHGWAAALHRLDMAPDLERSLDAARFWAQPSGRVYTLMGSFVRWLVDERGGADRFRRAYGWTSLEAEYGASIGELVEAWRTWLEAFPLSDAELEVARERYARGAVFERVCARVTATRMVDIRRAHSQGRLTEARAEIHALVQGDAERVPLEQSRQIRLWAAQQLRHMGAPQEAYPLLVALQQEEGGSAAQRELVLLELADTAWGIGEEAHARVMLEELADGVSASTRRAAQARLAGLAARETAPLTATAIRRHLVDLPRPSMGARIAGLLHAHQVEGSPWAAYLALLSLDEEAPPTLIDSLVAAVEAAQQDDAGEPEVGAPPLGTAQRAQWVPHALRLRMLGGAMPDCDELRQEERRWSAGSAVAAELRMWRVRCEEGLVPSALLPAVEGSP